nr:MAG TPA_asm: hypothetical protein [Bacteriophage sp.]
MITFFKFCSYCFFNRFFRRKSINSSFFNIIPKLFFIRLIFFY